MTKLVLIVDPRNLVLGNKTSKTRHQIYAEQLTKKLNGEIVLGVIRVGNKRFKEFKVDHELLIITIPRNPILLFSSLREVLMELRGYQVRVLVAGDPWESLIASLTFQRVFFPSAKIQTQIHGDIGNPIWFNARIQNKIRSKLAKKFLPHSDQIRATSPKQAFYLRQKYQITPSKLRIVPVPSLLTDEKASEVFNQPRPATLGLVGRLQHDRGLDSFVELVSLLSKTNVEFSVVIAGAGSGKRKLEADLLKYLSPDKVLFLGEVEGTEMHEVWKQIGVLVSTAPTESFGRAMREAMFHGVPVWATPSTGVSSLKDSVSGSGIQLINFAMKPEQLRSTFEQLMKTFISKKDRETIARLDSTAILDLITTWKELAT